MNTRERRGLLVVDVQNDFLPGGALAVADGDQVLAPINRLLAERGRLFDVVVATQDWHPADHESFASQHPGASPGGLTELHGLTQVLWPDHCVQESFGARFHESLATKAFDVVFRKGCNRRVDSYSGFFDNGRRGDTGLDQWLKDREITRVFVCGLATDYCVRFTAMDALSLGFTTTVVTDAVRGVNLAAGDSDKALREMKDAGIRLLRTADILRE